MSKLTGLKHSSTAVEVTDVSGLHGQMYCGICGVNTWTDCIFVIILMFAAWQDSCSGGSSKWSPCPGEGTCGAAQSRPAAQVKRE